MSNDIFTRIDVTPKPTAVPPAEKETKDEAANVPEVPITADLPMLPEFRNRAEVTNRRAALTTAGLAAFLATIGGVGCGKSSTIRKPSPAIPLAGSTPTLNVATGRNFGPVAK